MKALLFDMCHCEEPKATKQSHLRIAQRFCNLISVLLICIFIFSVAAVGVGWAREEGEEALQAQAAQPQLTDAQRRQILGNNFAALQNQQARVVVLQQLLNRELADLRQMQAVFCDNYGLNVEKWRKGLYIYDEAAGQFVERKPEKKKEASKKKKRGWGRKKR